jgi:hypothetical protein
VRAHEVARLTDSGFTGAAGSRSSLLEQQTTKEWSRLAVTLWYGLVGFQRPSPRSGQFSRSAMALVHGKWPGEEHEVNSVPQLVTGGDASLGDASPPVCHAADSSSGSFLLRRSSTNALKAARRSSPLSNALMVTATLVLRPRPSPVCFLS